MPIWTQDARLLSEGVKNNGSFRDTLNTCRQGYQRSAFNDGPFFCPKGKAWAGRAYACPPAGLDAGQNHGRWLSVFSAAQLKEILKLPALLRWRQRSFVRAPEKRLARRRYFVYNTRLWKGSEEAVTRSTRNRVIGDEPVRGFESHPFRHTVIFPGL